MKSTTTPTDIQSLTQDYYPAAYSLQLQAEELAAPMTLKATPNGAKTLKPSDWRRRSQSMGRRAAGYFDDGAQVLIKREALIKMWVQVQEIRENWRHRNMNPICCFCTQEIGPGDVSIASPGLQLLKGQSSCPRS